MASTGPTTKLLSSTLSRARPLAQYVIRQASSSASNAPSSSSGEPASVVVYQRRSSSGTTVNPTRSSPARSSASGKASAAALPFFDSSRAFHNATHPHNAAAIASSMNSSPTALDYGPPPLHSSHHSSSPPSSPSTSSSPLFGKPPPPATEGTLVLSQPGAQAHRDSSLIADSSSGNGSAASVAPTTNVSSSSGTSSSQSDRATFFTSDTAASFPSTPLPAFFGTSLNVARRNNLVFRNGAYGIPKAPLSSKGKEKLVERETNEPEHALSVGIGEDAYFLRTDSFGVADGVGGWSGHAGANPARWARKLMHHCSSELARYDNVEDELFLQYYEVDPVDVLQRAFEKALTECKDEGVIGSSTALMAVLRNDELRIANLGDCCCSIIRGDDYIFRSEEQQHSFNFPFQAGTTSRDTPIKDAQRFDVKVQKDDIVILSSDGLVDNLFDDDILEEVLRFVASNPLPPTAALASPSGLPPGPRYTLNRFSPQLVSEALCLRAKSVYEDQRAVTSPFQQRAMEEGIHFAGGKRDDVSVLVAVVSLEEASPDRR